MDLIEWKQSEKNFKVHHGRVNGVHLYTVRSSNAHGDLAKTHPYALDHRLPFAAVRRIFATAEGAQEYAERHLDAAMLHLGYVKREAGG